MPREYFFFDFDRDPQDQPQIDWHKRELIAPDVTYFDIHVLRAPNQDQTDDAENNGQVLRDEVRETPPTKSQRGRSPTANKIHTKVNELWDEPAFKNLPNRTAQAREVRAQLHGEDARYQGELIGYNDSTIKRIIGQVKTNKSE